MTKQAMERLLLVCTAWDIPLTARQQEQFATYDQLLCQWNERMDLTNVTEPLERVDRHYLDSIAPLAYGFAPQPGQKVLDVGTGAGLPGIPLAILCPEHSFCLMDALQKRIAFLQAVAEACLPNVQAIHARAETLGQAEEFREGYALVVSRAVAPLAVLMEYLLPFVAPGGMAVAYKGPGVIEELSAGQAAARQLGGRLDAPVPINIPGRDWGHVLIPIHKEKKTPEHFPRREGLPRKRPLGG